ncbi:MAG: hypothetical protein Q4G69_14040, partial [Planctomycetia bacterium]|nr:hypothetical protein [Planctomycetia bacterium]
RHYGLETNPFSEEDAQTDPVFKDSCIKTMRHPSWDKLYGNPQEPSTALVFGEKGSGKTALRLQMIYELKQFNADHPDFRPFVIDYSDMNPFLDQFRNRFSRGRKISKVFHKIQLQDHLDAILSLGITQFVDRALKPTECNYPAAVDPHPIDLSKLTAAQSRDLLSLAAAYDQCREESPYSRFKRLIGKSHGSFWKSLFLSWRDFGIGIFGSAAILTVFTHFKWYQSTSSYQWFLLFLIIAWGPYLWKLFCRFWRTSSVSRTLRMIRPDKRELFASLMRLLPEDYSSLTLPMQGSTENRYNLLSRFIAILNNTGFNGIIVLFDKVDEPYLINGSPDLMKEVIWPLMDNKLLKHEKLGLKFLLPIELYRFMEKESKDFNEKARLDKQNVIPSLSWSGEALFDLVNARMKACIDDEKTVSILDFFDGVDRHRLIDTFGQLRVPRHLFKFLYRLLMKHAESWSEDVPSWKITAKDFESTLALYLRDREVAERDGRGFF